MYGNDFRAEDFAHLFEHVLIVGFFTVELVECENDGLFERGGRAEDILCAYFDTILCVDHDKAGVGDVEGGDSAAHEVVGARAVDHIEFLAEEFGIEHRREYRIAIFFFYGEIVGYGIFCFYCAAAFYNSTLEEHSFSECGFTRAFASEQGYVFDFFGFVSLHAISVVFCIGEWMASGQALG